MTPRPTTEALKIAADLHTRLAKNKHMYSLFDKRFREKGPDEFGRLQLFKPGRIVQCRLDTSTMIPLFTKVLRRTGIPRNCSSCSVSMCDINFESEEQWEKSCEGFEGPWMDRVLLFPRKKLLNCDHDVTACKECYAKHLGSQLEEGQAGNESLSCLECSKTLNYDDAQRLRDRVYFREEA
jgi:hypothetical protein